MKSFLDSLMAIVRNRRLMSLIGGALVVVVAGVTFGIVQANATDNRINTSGIRTQTPDTLTVCADFPYAPFDLEDNGNYSGIDVDLVDAIGNDLDYKVVFKQTVFDGIFDAMKSGACDMVASAVSISEERKKSMLFSNGYFEVNQSLMVRQDKSEERSGLGALKGQKIGVQSGTTAEEYANSRAKGSTVVTFEEVDSMYDALEKGVISGVINDFPVNSYRASKDSSFKVVQTFNDVDREEYGFAFPVGAELLRDAVNESLERILNDGRYDGILSKYLGAATAL